MNKSILVAALLAVGVQACSDNNHQAHTARYQSAPIQQVQGQQPTVIVQESGVGTGTAILGAAAIGTAAYMAGKAANQQAPAANSYVQPQQQQRPVYQAPVQAARPAVAPTPAPTTTKASAPSTPKPLYNLQPTKIVAPRTVSASAPVSKSVSLAKR